MPAAAAPSRLVERIPQPFLPNPNQVAFADAVLSHPTWQRVDFYCKAAGIHRVTYYRWCHDPGFRSWFARSIAEQFYMDGWVLLNQARNNASQKFQYWKALFHLTFDPKGQEMMKAWKAGLEQPSAFAPLDPDPPAAPQIGVASPTQSNQQLTNSNVYVPASPAAGVHPSPTKIARNLFGILGTVQQLTSEPATTPRKSRISRPSAPSPCRKRQLMVPAPAFCYAS